MANLHVYGPFTITSVFFEMVLAATVVQQRMKISQCLTALQAVPLIVNATCKRCISQYGAGHFDHYDNDYNHNSANASP